MSRPDLVVVGPLAFAVLVMSKVASKPSDFREEILLDIFQPAESLFQPLSLFSPLS